ncbi:FAD-binding oxidoreductase [Neolewinella aurantiaca]|uniref:FAD-binding oxidoreductase n=1 Tax=Neolewinella aurantiaca TaxID=2602767 RepID=A0A5C7FXC5_9BACT|nr:FAD-dependent oxidoreductase [Neolewinella aurantiaca]TXF91418.1 FAD-binding oxidoreductase [Neolewinella aurantiaca]
MKFLIIGQGLAGTLTGRRLELAGHTVHYIDAPEQTASSSVAAGIINPITGRRFVKSWRIDELIPEAKSCYLEFEKLLGLTFWHEQPLIRTLYNRGDLNDWQARSADAGYPEYMDDNPAPGRIPVLTVPVFAYAGVRHAARVDVAGLVAAFRERITSGDQLKTDRFDYSGVPRLLGAEPASGEGRRSAGATKGQKSSATYDHIICCEGWRARFNPYFSYLPHGGNKGEVLIVKTEAPVLDRMFKHRVFLVPLSDDTYWVGATSENKFPDDSPTPANRKFLEDRLAEVLTGTKYEIIDHRAAVRPTVRDRRMFIGQHPELPRLWIFNGLGTKGGSLAPLGSRWLAEAILNGSPIPAEVNIDRFSPKKEGL